MAAYDRPEVPAGQTVFQNGCDFYAKKEGVFKHDLRPLLGPYLNAGIDDPNETKYETALVWPRPGPALSNS